MGLSLAFAIVVDKQGERHILGFELGDGISRRHALRWTDFLRSLRERGLTNTKLVTSDAHGGLVPSLSRVFSGAAWQRCTVHFPYAPALSAGVRNVLSQMADKDKKQVADAPKLIFQQPDYLTVQLYFELVSAAMESRWTKVAEMLWEAKDDILVWKTFPKEHHRSIHSINPLVRLNRKFRQREQVVGVFPDRSSVYCLIGTFLMNVDGDWQYGRRYTAEKGIQNSLILSWK